VLDLSPACAVIREESSMNTGAPVVKSNQARDLPASVYPLTLQVPDEKWHKNRKAVKPVEEGGVKKNGWVGD